VHPGDIKILNINEKNINIKSQVGILNQQKLELNEQLNNISNVDEEYNILKKQNNEINEKELQLNRLLSTIKTRIEYIEKNILRLNKEIKDLEETKNKLKKKQSTRNWIKKHFLNLIELIEKHVMLKIQQEFDEYFQEWFNLMIEDENITARLDEKFTPIIEQDGYEIEFNDLSGGEKTSVALSYKLALNKVINDLISEINTKDFLILDEPTDGFSSEQLDKIKEILDSLKVKQIIIVSHESKIETFVDKVIRIEKNNNLSQIV